MTLRHARILKREEDAPRSSEPTAQREIPAVRAERAMARRIPRETMEAHAEAERILADARVRAEATVAGARAALQAEIETVVREARERELARVAAEVLAVRAAEERRREGELDRTIEIATLLAERVVGEGLRLEPERIAVLATEALREARGARRVRIEASPEDVPALTAALAGLGVDVAEIAASPELGRGSLLLHTDLGRIDARLAPQLQRLASALREVLAAPGIQGKSG